jgi:hypothetical protein
MTVVEVAAGKLAAPELLAATIAMIPTARIAAPRARRLIVAGPSGRRAHGI